MYTLQGIDLRIVEGRKFPGDLRLEHYANGSWQPTKMEIAFFLVDFFAENEDVRRHYMGESWRENGQRYFMKKCWAAVRNGWRSVAAEIERQRGRAAA